MSVENNKMQVDIENLFKQNVNDLSSIKELYRKIQDIENKFLQIKYIDSNLANKLKKEYEKLRRVILDENVQAKLDNDIKTINVKLTNYIESINSQMETITQKVELPITLDKCDSELLGAIQNKEGETTFNLLSIPRDNSVNITKLDDNIKNTMYSSTIFDDSQVERKGTVGASDLYIINNNFKDCIINSITLSCLDFGTGEVRIYEKNDDIVTLVKTISFDTRVLGTNKPKINVNCKVNNGYIGFTRGEGSIDFGTKNTFGFFNCTGKKAETSFNITESTLFDNFSMKVKIETNKIKIVTKDDLKNNISEINRTYITVDKNGNGEYTSIQDAINNYNGTPIFVRNGIYEEGRIECADKDITIIGENKYKTIIANYGGLYGNDCLYASNGIFSNMTFISEIKEGITPNIGQQNGAYAVHVDSNNQAEGTCIFNDCIMISDFNAPFGNGLRKNNTVELNNCELISRQEKRGQDFANGGMGALFTHNNHTGTGDNCPNQVIRLNNCRLKAKLKNVIRIQEVAKNNAQAILDINNCLLYSETNGVTDVIKHGNVSSFDEMSIWKLSDTSYGNTVKELNKF